MILIKFIPNLITLLNLLSGCIALCFAFTNQMEFTALFVILGIVFDFFDGFAARMLKVQSELGKQLDSLADMVTSGVVPGLVMVQLICIAIYNQPLLGLINFEDLPWFAFFGFVITLASCYRLANFNIDENQKDSFIGLPTPANTILVLSLPLVGLYTDSSFFNNLLKTPVFLIGFVILSSYLLNAKIELIALKFKSFGYADNKYKYWFLISSVVLLGVLKVIAIPIVIIWYVIISMLAKK